MSGSNGLRGLRQPDLLGLSGAVERAEGRPHRLEVPVPGDTDEYEWKGYIPFDQLPRSFNPESGLIVTANARVVGPDYKPYLTDHWEGPYRTARIFDLLNDKHDLRPEDMLRVQTDTYSFPHVFIAEQLVSAERSAPAKLPENAK